MTLGDLINSDASNVLLDTSDFATSVTQWPCGLEQNSTTVTAVVMVLGVSRSTEAGEEDMHDAELQVASSVSVDERDIWLLSGEKYSVDRLEKSEYGIRPIYLKRHERRQTSKIGGTVL
jgi:hypothetical protein